MRYRVRTPEGELEYESLLHVEQAYLAGLVDPEDEVLEEGGTLWRKAATLPNLARARNPSAAAQRSSRVQFLTILIAVVLGVFALLLVRSGRGLWALLIALGIASLLWRVTYNAFRRKR
jgi:Flp pilus assembly protein TadB